IHGCEVRANGDYLWIVHEISRLDGDSLWSAQVVTIHPSNEFPFGQLEPHIACPGQTLIVLSVINETLSVRFHYASGVVFGTIVDDHDFDVGIGLCKDRI